MSAILGPSKEMVEALLEIVVDSVSKYSEVFEYNIEDALLKIHNEVDRGIDIIAGAYPEANNVEYIMVYQGGHVCDFMACNDFTQEVVDVMKVILDGM
jgi:hypothetical protein